MGIAITDAAGNTVHVAGVGGVNYIPPGGLPGQLLVKKTTAEYDLTWGTYQVGVNLLDNSHFVPIYDANGNMMLPINQRGVTGTITTPGYFIDRWILVSGSVTITENGLVLNGTIVQRLENSIGQPVTASALTTSGIVSAEYSDEEKVFSITGTGQTFVAAKLELGSVKTIAHKDANGNWILNDSPPNRALELAKCQRHQLFGSMYATYLSKNSAGSAYFCSLHTPQTMRAVPTICGTINARSVHDDKILPDAVISVNSVEINGVLFKVTNVSETVYLEFLKRSGIDSNL